MSERINRRTSNWEGSTIFLPPYSGDLPTYEHAKIPSYDKGMSIDETAAALGISRERMLQAEAKALRKLRRLVNMTPGLKEALLDIMEVSGKSKRFANPGTPVLKSKKNDAHVDGIDWCFWSTAPPEVIDIYLARWELDPNEWRGRL